MCQARDVNADAALAFAATAKPCHDHGALAGLLDERGVIGVASRRKQRLPMVRLYFADEAIATLAAPDFLTLEAGSKLRPNKQGGNMLSFGSVCGDREQDGWKLQPSLFGRGNDLHAAYLREVLHSAVHCPDQKQACTDAQKDACLA